MCYTLRQLRELFLAGGHNSYPFMAVPYRSLLCLQPVFISRCRECMVARSVDM
jgi:hypothetical protein